jgi:hypothetical protein
MWTSDPSGGSNFSNDLPLFDGVAFIGDEFRTMSVEGIEPQAVIENNCLTAEE